MGSLDGRRCQGCGKLVLIRGLLGRADRAERPVQGPEGQARPHGAGHAYCSDQSGASAAHTILYQTFTDPQPFPPDFFQVHASTCSIIRDVYKKLLGMMLPSIAAPPPQAAPGAAPLARAPHPSSDPIQTLFHPSTFIQSANFSETDPLSPNISFNPSIFNANHGSNISYNTFSPETLSISGFQTPSTAQHSGTNSDGRVATPFGDVMSTGAGGGFATGEGVSVSIGAVQHDAFQALLAGELPGDRTLVGDGQKMIPQLLELFQKLDARLKVSRFLDDTKRCLSFPAPTNLFTCQRALNRYLGHLVRS